MSKEQIHQHTYPTPSVLVAIMNNRRDFEIAQKEGWYRIPVKSADRLIRDLQEMRRLAFYQTKIFKEEAYAVNYYADIDHITKVRRIDLLPGEARNKNAHQRYYRLQIAPLQKLSQPIPSKRLRRLVFITTTAQKFRHAKEINDLFHTSPLEDQMWEALKNAGIPAERQHEIREPNASYNLDFAVKCKDGSWINIECNGDTYHSTKEARDRDRQRNTYLTTKGWLVQRFGTEDIRQNLSECINQVRTLLNQHEGPVERDLDYDLYRSDTDSQLKLF